MKKSGTHLKKIYTMAAWIMVVLAAVAQAQDLPTPASSQKQPILLRNGRVHVGDGRVLEKTDILLDNGKIIEIGPGLSKPSTAREVDATGKEIYPGLIACYSTLGLSEIEAARPTRDDREVGSINPNARALIAFNTDSRVIPTVRSNGVLLAQITPQGGTLSGTASVVQLDAWNYEDAVVSADNGLIVQWPSMSISSSIFAPPADVQKKNSEKALNELFKAFEDAYAYFTAKKTGNSAALDLKWESVIPVFEKKRRVFIRANDAKQIQAAVALLKKYDMLGAIIGGYDSWRVAPLLKEHNIPVIITDTHAIPGREDEDYDLRYKLPKLLLDAGVTFAITIDGSWQQRNLAFQAGSGVAFGLSKEEALTAITKSPAEILGINDRMGTIEKGKDATLIVVSGDIMDMRSSIVEQAFIQGRGIDLGNKQTDLYQRFKKKYDQN